MMRFTMLSVFALVASASAAKADLNATEIAPGLYRGRVPKTEADFAELRRLGVCTVLDIRGNAPFGSWRERRRVEAHGLTYRNVRLGFFPLRDGSGEHALAALTNEADYPLYVHCQVNKDRTSALVAAFRMRHQGWSISAAEAEANAFGIRRIFIGLTRYIRAGGMN